VTNVHSDNENLYRRLMFYFRSYHTVSYTWWQ